MTPEECIEIGGHCFEERDYVLMVCPGVMVRSCKHCNQVQHGYEQPRVRWENVD